MFTQFHVEVKNLKVSKLGFSVIREFFSLDASVSLVTIFFSQ